MTLILGIDCADALLLSSDSQMTSGSFEGSIRSSMQKLFAPWSNVCWGGAGDINLLQRVRADLTSRFPSTTLFEGHPALAVKRTITQAVSESIREFYAKNYLGAIAQRRPAATFIFMGSCTDGPFLLEIGPDGSDVETIETGYAAVGSGSAFSLLALSNLSHFNTKQRSSTEVKVLAYRVMEDVIGASAYGLGLPVQMIQLPKFAGNGVAATIIQNDEIESLEQAVITWKEIETAALSEFLGISPTSDENGQKLPAIEGYPSESDNESKELQPY